MAGAYGFPVRPGLGVFSSGPIIPFAQSFITDPPSLLILEALTSRSSDDCVFVAANHSFPVLPIPFKAVWRAHRL